MKFDGVGAEILESRKISRSMIKIPDCRSQLLESGPLYGSLEVNDILFLTEGCMNQQRKKNPIDEWGCVFFMEREKKGFP